MTTETILTHDQIRAAIDDAGPDNYFGLSRAIEQTVLQSPEVRALRRDAGRFRKVIDMTRAEREKVLFFPCDKDVVHAIDDAMEQQK